MKRFPATPVKTHLVIVNFLLVLALALHVPHPWSIADRYASYTTTLESPQAAGDSVHCTSLGDSGSPGQKHVHHCHRCGRMTSSVHGILVFSTSLPEPSPRRTSLMPARIEMSAADLRNPDRPPKQFG